MYDELDYLTPEILNEIEAKIVNLYSNYENFIDYNYTPKNWINDELVYADDIKHIEDGIDYIGKDFGYNRKWITTRAWNSLGKNNISYKDLNRWITNIESFAPSYKIASGNKINFKSTIENAIRKINLYGKSTQETRSGKNLLPNSAKSGVTNGLTFTVNKDKSISIKGTATARTLFNINSTKPIKLLTNSQYTLSKNGDIECVEIYLRKSSVSEIIASMTKSQASKTFTNTYAEDMFCYIAINSGVTIDTTITLQLEKGTVATKYEPYGIMPSLDYPSEIKSVGYTNLFNSEEWYKKLNSISNTSMQKEIVDGIEYYKFRPQSIYTYEYMKGQFKENTQYTITARARQYDNINLGSGPGFIFYYTDGTCSSIHPVDNTFDEYDYVITSDAGKTIDNIRLNYNIGKYVLMRNIMLKEGTKTHSYIPFAKYGIEVVNTGENLLKGLSTLLTDSSYWFDVNKTHFTPLEDGFGRFSYDNTNGSSTVFINAKVKFNATKLKPNTSYTIVTEIRNSEISKNSNTFLQLVTNNSTVAFQTSKNLGYEAINTGGTYKGVVMTKANFDNVDVAIDTYLRLAKGTKGTVEARISLFEGDVEIDVSNFVYEPYKEHRTLFVLNDQLRSLPNGVRDIAYIKNNKLYVERKVKSNLVNISGIVTLSNGSIGGLYSPAHKIYKSQNSLISSSAIEDKSPLSFKEGTVYENPAGFVFVGNSTDTLETLKAKYDNSEIIYEIAEPIIEEIGEIEMLETISGENILTNSAETYMEIVYEG